MVTDGHTQACLAWLKRRLRRLNRDSPAGLCTDMLGYAHLSTHASENPSDRQVPTRLTIVNSRRFCRMIRAVSPSPPSAT